MKESTGRAWKKLMDERHPLHAKNYCVHGEYVGSNKIFEKNCPHCSEPTAV